MPKLACVAMVKNEARHIAEWLAYQYALGFDAVLLLDNMSTDETRGLALAAAGTRRLEILDWPVFDADYQSRGYDFAHAHLENEFDWLAFFDVDEFLVLDPSRDLKTCLAALPEAGAVAVPWAMFGSAGHLSRPSGLVVETYVYRSPASFWPNRHVKSIVRAAGARRCQNPHSFDVIGRYMDLAGRDVIWGQHVGVQAEAPDYRGGKLHHYFTRSVEDWVSKLRRGYNDTSRKPSDFDIYDRNEVFDDSAAQFIRQVGR